MDSAGNNITLLEGIGDEVIHTTLILATIILLFNLYWVYVVINRRNARATQQQSTLNNNPSTSDRTTNEDTTTSTNEDTTQPSINTCPQQPSHTTNEQQPTRQLQQQQSSQQQPRTTNDQPQQSAQQQPTQQTSSHQTTPTESSTLQKSQSTQNKPTEVIPPPIPAGSPLLNTSQPLAIVNDLTIKLQFVNGLQRIVSAKSEDTLGEFKRTHFTQEVTENRRVRLIMNGQELKNDTWNLRAYNICNNFVLHCLVSQHTTITPPSQLYPSQQQQNNPRFLNLGSLLYPMIGALLAFFWYARIYYRVYFNGASTFSLVALSFFYFFSSFAFFRIPVSSENLHQN